MENQLKWEIGVITFGLLIIMFFGIIIRDEGRIILQSIYGIPFVLFGILIILFKNRENKIEKIKEDKR